MGWVFLGVIFHQKNFSFYKIFCVSKQNFEKMVLFCWKIAKFKTSIWVFQLQNKAKYDIRELYFKFWAVLQIGLQSPYKLKVNDRDSYRKLKIKLKIDLDVRCHFSVFQIFIPWQYVSSSVRFLHGSIFVLFISVYTVIPYKFLKTEWLRSSSWRFSGVEYKIRNRINK